MEAFNRWKVRDLREHTLTIQMNCDDTTFVNSISPIAEIDTEDADLF